ncbi:MAG: nitrilase-related carbon-nitrogen hydrolase [Thermomicrobiales bacterium]
MDDHAAPAPAPYRVAVIQFEPTLFAKAANLTALARLVEDAAAGGAKLIVTPEMATTAYCWADRAEVAPDVEPIPGPSTDHFAEIARRHDCWIVLGMPEVDPETDVFYNSAVLIGPAGPVGVYRKTHAFIAEPTWAKDGDLGLPVFETPLGRIALTICMDACYPETARIPALGEADVICFPTNWLSEKSPSPGWIARAVENGVYFLAANRYGLERGVQFSGGSAVINPDGSLQGVVDDGDGIAWGEVDVAWARDKRWRGESPEDLLADRRPEAYGHSTLNCYLWPAADFHGLYELHPLPESRESRVAVVQMTPRAGEVAANLTRISQETAALAPVDLVVFPELALTGPVTDAETAHRLAQPIPGPLTEQAQAVAAAHDTYLVVGLVEQGAGSGNLYNSAALIAPQGVVGVYRKLHLSAEDRAWATPGDGGLPVFDVPPGRTGLLIGYDALFPEAARELALQGADIIACPSLLDGPQVRPYGATSVPFPAYVETGPTVDHFHLWRERERENHAHVLFANAGAPWMGWSGIFAAVLETEPRAEVVISGNAEGAVTATVGASTVTREKPMLGMRMPIWYDALQVPVDRAARVARTRGARREAWLGD